MVTREDDTTTVSLVDTELKSPTNDWSAEDMHKEFMVFKTLAKMWLETEGVPDYIQCMFILQLLGKECL